MTSIPTEKLLVAKEKRHLAKYGKPHPPGELPTYLRMLLYGPPNIGKTITACMIGDSNLLYAMDQNFVSLHNHPELKSRTGLIESQGLEHFSHTIDAVGNGYEGYTGYDNFIIDTLPQLTEKFIDGVTEKGDFLGKDGTKFREKVTFRDGFTIDGKSELPISAGPDYNLVRGYFRLRFDALGKLPMHVIYICHETDARNNIQGTANVIRGNLPQATYNSLVRRCNVIGHMAATNRGDRNIEFIKTPMKEAGAKIADLEGKTLSPEKFAEIIRKWAST